MDTTGKSRSLREFWTFFGIQFLQYFLITVNLRAIAAGLYGWTFASDLTAAANAYVLIKRVSEAKGYVAFTGYLAGGAFGGILAIYITKWLAMHGKF